MADSTDSDDPFDPNMFWVFAPVWVVNHESRVTIDEAGNPVLANERGVATAEGDRHKGIVVFTDRDLAERFVAALRPGLVPATFPSPALFAAFLRRAQARGDTHVAFDPAKTGRLISIDRVVQAIERDAR